MRELAVGLLLVSLPVVAGGAGERENRTFAPDGIHDVSVETETGGIEVVGVAAGAVQVEFKET